MRDEEDADMSISQAFSIVFSRKPELKLEGLAHNVLQWYLCRMEGWFAADADTISVQCWDQVSCIPFLLEFKYTLFLEHHLTCAGGTSSWWTRSYG